ncbi:MAG: hypothetical protein IKR18_11535 [Bacteroidaceae bacterium]|nr:hypothetical protein [Bacteroidaceae bacterium]
MIYRIQGNKIAFSVSVGRLDLQNEQVEVYDLTGCRDFMTKLTCGAREYAFKTSLNNGKLSFETEGNERCGVYDVVLTFIDQSGNSRRTKVRDQVSIVDAVEDLGLSSAVIEATEANLQILIEGGSESGVGISMADLLTVLAKYVTRDELQENLLTREIADNTYQPKGNYLTEHQSLAAYLTKALAEQTYQPKGNYLTEHQSLADYLTKALAQQTYQPKGNYLTEHQSLAAYLTKALAEQTYQPKGNYLTEHQSLTDYLTKALAEQTYQPKGNYLTEHQSLTGYLTKALAQQTYQPKGNYLTEHQDISGKADKELVVTMTNETATIEPNKFYVWGEVTDLDISLATPTDNTRTNVYHFRFTAGANAMFAVPANVIWQNNQEPPRTEGNTYEVSILNNCASYMEFEPYEE